MSLALSETPKTDYVASRPVMFNGPQSANQLDRGAIVAQNCMLAEIVILLNQKFISKKE